MTKVIRREPIIEEESGQTCRPDYAKMDICEIAMSEYFEERRRTSSFLSISEQIEVERQRRWEEAEAQRWEREQD